MVSYYKSFSCYIFFHHYIMKNTYVGTCSSPPVLTSPAAITHVAAEHLTPSY